MAEKVKTVKEYQMRVNKVLDYINANLGEPLDLNMLAEMSNFSPYHFHRIMRAHLNESLGSYIVRIRLETAVRLIIYSEMPLNEISYKIGYEVPSSFTKAFKKRFNISPASYRETKKLNVFSENKLDMNVTDFRFEFNPKFITRKPKQVVYIEVKGPYGNIETGRAWERLWGFVKVNKLFSWNMESLGVTYDDPEITEADKCRYHACITITKDIKPDGEIGIQTVEGGRFAVFKYKGTYTYLDRVYGSIFKSWFPESGITLRDAPCFEKYLNNPNKTKPEKLQTEIYIPIQ